MNLSLLSSLNLAMDASAHTSQALPLKDLPVFKTLEEPSSRKADPRSWNPRLSAERKSQALVRKQLNLPSLAAYSAVTEQPFYSRVGPYRPHFNEFKMQLELHERQLERIRSIGWDSIRPIGIEFTMKEQQEFSKLEAKHAEEEEKLESNRVTHSDGHVRMNRFEGENAELPTHGLQRSPPSPGPSPPPPDMDIDLDQDVQEDETSYDYGDEFARIDGEEEQDSDTQVSGVVLPSAERSERTVQQFIETSHIDSLGHPYDVENTYNGYSFDESEPHGETQQPSLLPPIRNQALGMTTPMSGATPLRNPAVLHRRSERRVTFDSSDCE
ncbi:Mnd2p LALA0_S04e10044g [Lachancea lanzarotensis]|uniref:LALA0S04e10044g1_1 n=1 Tax=Lachancea lanzarotensis TaxID=1245769 RepID=A0A0C7N2I5_9SACH|nr:uncharacterized protein LALA0_S04e10044g [Lachancea lanzarotensis]CEP62197.1 LALA0S04e10044g1_1 [Lachancea lanzarotensis]